MHAPPPGPNSAPPAPAHPSGADDAAAIEAADRATLHRFGYAQQLVRDMGGFQNFAVSFSVLSILTGAVTLYGHGLTHGGPLEMTIGWPLVTLLTLPVVLALAELASAYPTAGALYHWSALLGGAGWGWWTAWLNAIGQFAITAGIDWGLAEFLASLLGIERERSTVFALYAALLLSHGALNHVGVRAVAWLNTASAWYHLVGVVALVGALVLLAPAGAPGVLLSTRNAAPDFPYAYAFIVGLLQAQWTYTGYDASAHVTEETRDARRAAPRGMVIAVAVSAVFGYAMLLAVTRAISDVDAALASENPFLWALDDALGDRGAAAAGWMIAGAMWFCGLSSVTSASRMVFAFARDRGMPHALAKVSPRWRTPHRAVWAIIVCAALVALWSEAYSVIVALSTIALYASYGLPILAAVRARRRGGDTERGPWHLGGWSTAVRWVSLAWISVLMVLFVLPPNVDTGKFFAGCLVVLCVAWLARARRTFTGPRMQGSEAELQRLEAELGGAAR